MMKWQRLINRERIVTNGVAPPAGQDHRNAFQRDWDRVIFSTAFRRLHDKTQVFPIPDDDVIHSRLTHSLEVASVGRSLGSRSATLLGLTDQQTSDFGDVVSVACLAHDIGNPPFGHAGEDAIRRYFAAHSVDGLTERQQADLAGFEGNAQGLRILCRIQFLEYGGMRLTAGTLGAFLKYPRESGQDFGTSPARAKKFGVFQSELATVRHVAGTLGLPPVISSSGGNGWARHPLAYLVEAADDICNSILDLEDACRLGWITHDELDDRLVCVAPQAGQRGLTYRNRRDRTAYLRSSAIGVLVEECSSTFRHNADRLLQGQDIAPLIKYSAMKTQLQSLSELAVKKCYLSPVVLEREAAGYAAVAGLLERFVPCVLVNKQQQGGLEHRMFELLRQRAPAVESEVRYDRILGVLDYVSGMTDSFAIRCYRRLSGISS